MIEIRKQGVINLRLYKEDLSHEKNYFFGSVGGDAVNACGRHHIMRE